MNWKRLASAWTGLSLFGTALAPAAAFLFDATKAETAGNADWVISESTSGVVSRFPSPAASGITASTPETYWLGAISSWGVALVKLGHSVESLPPGSRITYRDGSNVQDLGNYQVFVVCEPNILFTATEKAAIINWVRDGGAIFMVSDHVGSDRNNDGADSVAIWNDLFTNNGVQSDPFGLAVNLDNISLTTSAVDTTAGNPLTNGPSGAVTGLKYSNGATLSVHPAANSSTKAVVWSSSTRTNSNAMTAYGTYGLGRFTLVGDSSPFDDGTGASGNTLFFGWTDLGGNHSRLILNASTWLAAAGSIPSVTVSAPIPNAAEHGPVNGAYQITRTGGPLTAALTVNFSTSSGTAVYGTDFTLSSGASSITIPGGSASVSVVLTPIAGVSIPGPNKTVNLALLGGTGYTLGATTSATITIAEEPFDAWRYARFGGSTDTAIVGETADPDGDGIPNLLEYAFGTDPAAPTPPSALPVVSTVSARPALTFTATKAAIDVQFVVEVSPDLASWQTGATYAVDAAGNLSRVAGPGGSAQASVTDNGSAFLVTEGAGAASRFLRLRVTRVP